jgi:two-component system cell cycle response regulator DivK
MQKTILLVEDNEDSRKIFRLILEHHGYSVLEARDGADGIRLAQQKGPDLILMDLSIPVIDGLEATRRIRQDPSTCSIPIVALTAHARAEDRNQAHRAGCDGYLAKPVDPKQVVEEVRRFVGASGTQSSRRPDHDCPA